MPLIFSRKHVTFNFFKKATNKTVLQGDGHRVTRDKLVTKGLGSQKKKARMAGRAAEAENHRLPRLLCVRAG